MKATHIGHGGHYFSRPGQISVALLLVFAIMFTTFAFGIYAARESRSISLFRGAVDAAAMTAGADLAKGATVMGGLIVLRVLCFGIASIALVLCTVTLNMGLGARIWDKLQKVSKGIRKMTRAVPLTYTIKAMFDARNVFRKDYPENAGASVVDSGLFIFPTRVLNIALASKDFGDLKRLLDIVDVNAAYSSLGEYMKDGMTVIAWRKRSVFTTAAVQTPASLSISAWMASHEVAVSATRVVKTMPSTAGVGAGLDLSDENTIDGFLGRVWDGGDTKPPKSPDPDLTGINKLIKELGSLEKAVEDAREMAVGADGKGGEILQVKQLIGGTKDGDGAIPLIDAYVKKHGTEADRLTWLQQPPGDKKALQDVIGSVQDGLQPVIEEATVGADDTAMWRRVHDDLVLLTNLRDALKSKAGDGGSVDDAARKARETLAQAGWTFLKGGKSLYEDGNQDETEMLAQCRPVLHRAKGIIIHWRDEVPVPALVLLDLTPLDLDGTEEALKAVTAQRMKCQGLFATLCTDMQKEAEANGASVRDWLSGLLTALEGVATSFKGIPGGNTLAFLVTGKYEPPPDYPVTINVTLRSAAMSNWPPLVRYIAQGMCAFSVDKLLMDELLDPTVKKDVIAYYAPVLTPSLENLWDNSSSTLQLGSFDTKGYVENCVTQLVKTTAEAWGSDLQGELKADLFEGSADVITSIAKGILSGGISLVVDAAIQVLGAVASSYLIDAATQLVTDKVSGEVGKLASSLIGTDLASAINEEMNQVISVINGILGMKPALIGAVMGAKIDACTGLRPTPCPWWDRRRLACDGLLDGDSLRAYA